MFKNLLKAAVATAATPVALVADIVTLPASAMDHRADPFKRTGSMLKAVADNVTKAVDPKDSK